MGYDEKFREARKKKLETFSDEFGDGEINNLKSNIVNSNNSKNQEMDIDDLMPFSEYDKTCNQYDYEDERFDELMESIKEIGLIEPLIVWENEENGKKEYIILSGKHRWLALKKLSEEDIKYKKVPVITKKDITKEEAIFIFNTSNMTRRSFESMKSYQKAKALSQITDSFMKIIKARRKELGDLTVSVGGKATKQVGSQYGLGATMVFMYCKIYKTLEKIWFDLIDEHKITIKDAYNLTNFDKSILKDILEMIQNGTLNLTSGAIEEMKDVQNKGENIDIKKVVSICNKKKVKSSYNIKTKDLEEFGDLFKEKDEKETIDIIMEALKYYRDNHSS